MVEGSDRVVCVCSYLHADDQGDPVRGLDRGLDKA